MIRKSVHGRSLTVPSLVERDEGAHEDVCRDKEAVASILPAVGSIRAILCQLKCLMRESQDADCELDPRRNSIRRPDGETEESQEDIFFTRLNSEVLDGSAPAIRMGRRLHGGGDLPSPHYCRRAPEPYRGHHFATQVQNAPHGEGSVLYPDRAGLRISVR